MFEFVSHESYPDDEYTKEAVTLCFDGKYRVTYLRKKMQSGAMFWDVISGAVKQHGEKKYLKSFTQDSNFLWEDIKAFLESRSWEKSNRVLAHVQSSPNPENSFSAPNPDELPF